MASIYESFFNTESSNERAPHFKPRATGITGCINNKPVYTTTSALTLTINTYPHNSSFSTDKWNSCDLALQLDRGLAKMVGILYQEHLQVGAGLVS